MKPNQVEFWVERQQSPRHSPVQVDIEQLITAHGHAKACNIYDEVMAGHTVKITDDMGYTTTYRPIIRQER